MPDTGRKTGRRLNTKVCLLEHQLVKLSDAMFKAKLLQLWGFRFLNQYFICPCEIAFSSQSTRISDYELFPHISMCFLLSV